MGYNKVVLFCNDGDHAIDQDPVGWWNACKQAFANMWGGKGDSKFNHRNCYGHWQAVWQEHADYVGVIIVGGNYATVVGSTFTGSNGHHKEADQIRILKDVLQRKGYIVYKKPLASQRKKHESHHQS